MGNLRGWGPAAENLVSSSARISVSRNVAHLLARATTRSENLDSNFLGFLGAAPFLIKLNSFPLRAQRPVCTRTGPVCTHLGHVRTHTGPVRTPTGPARMHTGRTHGSRGTGPPVHAHQVRAREARSSRVLAAADRQPGLGLQPPKGSSPLAVTASLHDDSDPEV